jgi:hypothetical protein
MKEFKEMGSGSAGFVTMHSYYREFSCVRRKAQCLFRNSAYHFDNKYWDCEVQQPGVRLLHNTANLGILVASICMASQSGESSRDCLHSDTTLINFSAFSTAIHIQHTFLPRNVKRMLVSETSIPFV